MRIGFLWKCCESIEKKIVDFMSSQMNCCRDLVGAEEKGRGNKQKLGCPEVGGMIPSFPKKGRKMNK